MDRTPVMLHLNTTEYWAVRLLELLTDKAKSVPSNLPEQAQWRALARQVVDCLVAQQLSEEATVGRGV